MSITVQEMRVFYMAAAVGNEGQVGMENGRGKAGEEGQDQVMEDPTHTLP